MTKKAHITSRPNHQVGDLVIGLCGKEFEVTVLWSDLPQSHKICRTCVDRAISALTEADQLIESVRREHLLIARRVRIAGEMLTALTLLDAITEADIEHKSEQDAQRSEQEAAEKAAVTCTCTWTSPEVFTEDPNCPIHGGNDAPPELEHTEEGDTE